MLNFTIRRAVPGDEETIVALLGELARFEGLQDKFRTNKEIIARDCFGDKPAFHCAFAIAGNSPAALAGWYWIYSSFAALRLLYIEDLYVRPALRGHGVGRAMLQWLGREAQAAGAVGLAWAVLDWNASAIAFYESLGAEPAHDWHTFRLTDQAFQRLVAN